MTAGLRGESPLVNRATPDEVDLVRRVLDALSSDDHPRQKAVLDEFWEYIEPVILRAANRILIHRTRRGELKDASCEVSAATFLGLTEERGRALKTWDEKKGGLNGWVWRVARRRALDWGNRRPNLAPVEAAGNDSDEGKFMEHVEKTEFLERLFEEIGGELTPAELNLAHMLLRLRWPAEKISEALGININSVYQRVFRIRRKLLVFAQRLRGEEG